MSEILRHCAGDLANGRHVYLASDVEPIIDENKRLRERIRELEIHPEMRIARVDGYPDDRNFPDKILLERNGNYMEYVPRSDK